MPVQNSSPKPIKLVILATLAGSAVTLATLAFYDPKLAEMVLCAMAMLAFSAGIMASFVLMMMGGRGH